MTSIDYTKIHLYSDVVDNGLVLPYKQKYTMRDVNKVIVDSLFNPLGTCDIKTACWIVMCSSVYWHYQGKKSDYSKTVTITEARYPIGWATYE